jgi:protein-S-isoprenylcysteine O-methyltransferase Ste14
MEGRPADHGGLGSFVFRWRSYLPLLPVLGLGLGLAAGRGPAPGKVRGWIAGGLLVAGAGLLLRLYAVGHAPPGTSGRHRRQYAERLNTFGVYSIVRHPLYLGNVLVWAGASLTSGWLAGSIVSALLAVAAFAVIARHEDGYLEARFGEPFREWAAVTPAFVPRLRLWRTARTPFGWRRAVASEYSTLHSIALLALLFAAVRGRERGVAPVGAWWILLAANSALSLTLRRWQRGGAAAQAPRGARAEGETTEEPVAEP